MHLLLHLHGDHFGDVIHRLRLVADTLHEEAELLWDLSEHFLSEVTLFNCFVELDELDDVSAGLTTGIVPQQMVV